MDLDTITIATNESNKLRSVENPPEIKIKYHDKEINKIEQIDIGNWIDLRAAETVEIKKGELKLISLGISVELPYGYEANIVPRSSTAKKFKILQSNHFGVVDSSYCGDNDIWGFMAYAIEDTIINKNDRICQFRINKIMGEIKIAEVNSLGNIDRGGFGSTGSN